MPTNRAVKITYRLGGICDGKRYVYTELPEFATLAAALKYQATRPGRNTYDVLLEEIPCVTNGVHWGTRCVLRSALDGQVLPT